MLFGSYTWLLLVILLHCVTGQEQKLENNNEDVEIIKQNGEGNDGKVSEDYYRLYGGGGGGRRRGSYGYAGRRYRNGYSGSYGGSYGYGGQYDPGVVRTRVTVQKRILRPVVGVHNDPLGVVDGPLVGRRGVIGRGSVAVNPAFIGGGPGIVVDPILNVRTGLPKCSYLDTDFDGNDVGDGRGLTAGSPYACKQRCIDESRCQFWTYRHGWERDCYLKRGGGRDDVLPSNVTPRPGFISGTARSDCVCLSESGINDAGEICPVRRSGGRGFPWRVRGDFGGGVFRSGARFDYDDYDDDVDDDRREVVTTRLDADGVDQDGVVDGDVATRERAGTRRRRTRPSRRRNNNLDL